MRPDHHRIAELLCQSTREVLLVRTEDWIRRRIPAFELQTIVGTGKRTYHLRRNETQFQITYGVKMVASQQNPVTASNWASAREIRDRGYYGGAIQFDTLLAHVVCHEFSHLIQRINGWRYPGDVHNDEFYRVLDRVHAGGAGDEVLQYLRGKATEESISLNFSPGSQKRVQLASDFRSGEKIWFLLKGVRHDAIVAKVNHRTISVNVISPTRGTGKINPGIAHKAE